MRYATSATVDGTYEDVVPRVKAALARQGFGVLTEIDMSATMRQKIGVEMPPYLIIGACNPPLAHRAVTALPSIGVFLPCNVVVRQEQHGVVVEMLDPMMMAGITGDPRIAEVGEEAGIRLAAALAEVAGTTA